MKRARANAVEVTVGGRTAEAARARTLLLVLVCFLVGLAAGAYWYRRATNRPSANVAGTIGSLSASTKAILRTLESPVEIRFYALLDPASTSADLRDFAGRVDQLLSAFELEAGGKIAVARHTAQADSALASADGIKPFNLDKGDACFLGLALTCNDAKETLAQLSPEWESALESDLSRALARVAAKPVARPAATSAATVDAAVIAEVKRAIPDFGSMSLTEGTKRLRAAALKQIQEATEAMQQQVREAQQRIAQAQPNASEAEQQAAVKQLQMVQAGQTEKIKEISAKLQDQIAALQQLKKE